MSAASSAAVERSQQTVPVGINWAKVKFITPGFLPLELIYQCGKLVGKVELLNTIVQKMKEDYSEAEKAFENFNEMPFEASSSKEADDDFLDGVLSVEDDVVEDDGPEFSGPEELHTELMKEKDTLRDAAILGTTFKTMVYVTALLILPLSSVAIVGLTLKALVIVDLTMHIGSTAFVLYQNWSLPVIDFTPPQQAVVE